MRLLMVVDNGSDGVDHDRQHRLHGGRQIGAQVEVIGANADEDDRRGMPIELLGQLDENAGVDGVGSGEATWSAATGDLLHTYVARHALVLPRVDEHDQP